MRKLRQTLFIAVILVMSAFTGGGVSAASTCPIGFTGPDSTNTCVSTQTYQCTVTNNNQVDIVGQNAQGSISGNAGSGGNTSGGNVQTGTATNSNGASFNFEVTNGNVCTAVRTVAPTPAAPSAPGAPSAPAIKSQVKTPVAAPTNIVPTTLANTSGESAITPLAVGLLAVGAIALMVRWLLLYKDAR